MNWKDYKTTRWVNLPNEIHAEDDDWDLYESVNDPASGKKLPNEGHAEDDDWDEYEAVNDPASGKKLPNEGHAEDDDWDDFEAVNDPASGKKLPNEGHAAVQTDQPIFVTEAFVKNIADIYGSFSASDDEYPAMGITVQGSSIFVECIRFPDCAVIRRRTTDEVKREHPAVGALWREKLCQYNGKCRTSTVHIHPMNLPRLSGTDIRNYDDLRMNPNDASSYPTGSPYPVILVNLTSAGKLDLLGFWVANGAAHKVEVQYIPDDSPVIRQAWENAQAMPFFSEEGNLTRRINRMVSKEWDVELGVNPRTGGKAIKARRNDGKKVLIRFNSETPLGLVAGGPALRGFCFEDFIDWTRMFNELADCQSECLRVEKSDRPDAPACEEGVETALKAGSEIICQPEECLVPA